LIRVKEVAMVQKSAWDAELELGVGAVDAEHHLQARLVSVLRQAVESRRDPAVIEEILRRVEDTSNVHFMSEELLMRLHAYDHYGVHVEAHRQLIDGLKALRVRIESEPGADLLGSIRWVEEWLAAHIQGMDRRFVEAMSRGTPSPS
jgi:hemerythrin-like metal-binding protein